MAAMAGSRRSARSNAPTSSKPLNDHSNNNLAQASTKVALNAKRQGASLHENSSTKRKVGPSSSGRTISRTPFGEIDQNRLSRHEEMDKFAKHPPPNTAVKRARHIDELQQEAIFDANAEGSKTLPRHRKLSVAMTDRPSALRSTSPPEVREHPSKEAEFDLDNPPFVLPALDQGSIRHSSSSIVQSAGEEKLEQQPSSPAARLSLKRMAEKSRWEHGDLENEDEDEDDDFEYRDESAILGDANGAAGNISKEMFRVPSPKGAKPVASPSEAPTTTSNKENDPRQLFKRQSTTPRGRAVPSPPLSPSRNHLFRRRSKTIDEIEHLREKPEDSPDTRLRKRKGLEQYDRNLGLRSGSDDEEPIVLAMTKPLDRPSHQTAIVVKGEPESPLPNRIAPSSLDEVKRSFRHPTSLKAKMARMLSSSAQERSEPAEAPVDDKVQWDDDSSHPIGDLDPFGFLETEKKLNLRHRSGTHRQAEAGKSIDLEYMPQKGTGKRIGTKENGRSQVASKDVAATLPRREDSSRKAVLSSQKGQRDEKDLSSMNAGEEEKLEVNNAARLAPAAKEDTLSSRSSSRSNSKSAIKDSSDSNDSSSPIDDGLDLSELRTSRRAKYASTGKGGPPTSKRRPQMDVEETKTGGKRDRLLSDFELQKVKPARKRTGSTVINTASTASTSQRKKSGGEDEESVQNSQEKGKGRARLVTSKNRKGLAMRRLKVGEDDAARQQKLGLRPSKRARDGAEKHRLVEDDQESSPLTSLPSDGTEEEKHSSSDVDGRKKWRRYFAEVDRHQLHME